MKKYSIALTIAGSDSGGGAGIQADLKTFSALGCYGMSVITAITAQNTREVRGVFPVPPAFVRQQLEAVLEDIGTDAVKIGMLHSAEIIAAVAGVLKSFGVANIVLDPVMVAKSGDRLIEAEAVAALKEHLLPLATVVTPNLPESAVLLEKPEHQLSNLEETARLVKGLGARAVLQKGGHLPGEESYDVLYFEGKTTSFQQQRIHTANTHGTGCTLSSAIAAHLALGLPLGEAVRRSKIYISEAIAAGSEYSIGHGHGPVKHFFGQW